MPGTSSSAAAAAAAPPVVSRRHAAGAPSARSLLFTILGELVLPGDETAWTSALVSLFGRLGIEEKTARQAVMRSASAGWLEAEKFGRRTRWRLTGSARRLLTDGAERIYSLAGPAPRWDGQWLLVATRVPDSERRARHVLRTRLSWAGFGSLGGGLWISPHADREAEALDVLREAGVSQDAHVFLATRSGVGDAAGLVEQAWDLADVEAQYREFVAEFSGAAPADITAAQIELVHAWRRFPSIDPALPPELLPGQWSGRPAAQLFATLHERWSAAARGEWERLNDV